MRHIAHTFHHQFTFTDMKIQIRQGVFETNSSSVHTLSISKSISKFSKIKDSITKITFGPKQEYYFLAIFLNKN